MYKVPDLPYEYTALQPIISEKIMKLHHDKHHAAYATNVNKALAGTGLEEKPIEDVLKSLDTVPEKVRKAVQNNGGGHANHSLFWQILRPPVENNKPSDMLTKRLAEAFGSYEDFKEKFTTAGMTQFGSGWAWLVKKGNDGLAVYSTPNQDSPYMSGDTPILGLDVWEHAYYLDYLNDRAAYAAAWWQIVNWEEVEKRLQ